MTLYIIIIIPVDLGEKKEKISDNLIDLLHSRDITHNKLNNIIIFHHRIFPS